MKLLDNAGLTYVYQKLKTKFVQQESGKGLSTNDYTDDEKSKVAGAEQKSNKVTSLSSSSTDTQYPSAKAVYNNLELKVDKVSGKGLSTNDYTTAEKTKLAGIEDNANNYTLPIASDTTLGGIKVGENLTIDADGKLNASGGGTWGSITGTLSDQTDLQSALNSKVGTRDEIITELNNYTPEWKSSTIASGNYGNPLYANGIWVAGSSNNGLVYSTDGKNWIPSNVTTGNRNVSYANNMWFSGGSVSPLKYSYDGKTWQDTNATLSGYDSQVIGGVQYNNGTYVAVTSGAYKTDGAYWSTDGITWSKCSGLSYWMSISYGNGVWVAGITRPASRGELRYSTDGKDWVNTGATTVAAENPPVYANGIWVHGDKGEYETGSDYRSRYSYDGKNWTNGNITNGGLFPHPYQNGLWTGYTDSTQFGGYKLVYSTDGITWVGTNFTPGSKWARPKYANGIWVCIGTSGIYYSYDGKTWSPSNITTDGYNTPTYNNGMWIAGSASNGIIQSVDGKVWTASNITSGNYNSPITDNGMTLTGSSANGIKYLKETNKIIKNFNLEQTPATTTKLGSIKVGNNLSVSADGTLSANTSSLDRGHTLTVGSTSITITNSAITTSSAIDVWCSIPKISYETITISNGSVTLTFEAQATNMEVGVMIVG